MYANSCAPPCNSTPILVQIPGVPGLPGTPGTPGATGATGATGANGISPSLASVAGYGSGTAYALTATPALLNLGTTAPSITITSPGAYLLWAHARFDFNGATFAADQTITAKIHCTTNTVQDIPNTVKGYKLPIVTTLSYTGAEINIAPVQYVATAGDVLQLWGSISVVPSAGTMDTVEADIIAVQVAGGSGSLGGQAGIGNPNGVVTAPPGITYADITNPAIPIIYFKTSGTGNVGWVAVIS